MSQLKALTAPSENRLSIRQDKVKKKRSQLHLEGLSGQNKIHKFCIKFRLEKKCKEFTKNIAKSVSETHFC